MDDLTAWLTLIRAPGLGGVRLGRLLERFGSAQAVSAASARDLESLGVPAAAVASLADPDGGRIDLDLAWLDRPEHHLIVWGDPRYPQQLAEIPAPPAAFFVHGDPAALQHPQIAIVGSRHPTPSGAEAAKELARNLSSRGLVVTSGLAQGVDGQAHRGALAGGGVTVAVFGTGVDRVYPAAHRSLAHEVVAQGALISELPLGSPPQRAHFPLRNRIISGLSIGVLVVEAARHSGSLITARMAADQGRDVFAMPGSIHNPMAKGCHLLIRQGAKLVESANDVLEELSLFPVAAGTGKGSSVRPDAAPDDAARDPEYEGLLNAIGFDPVSVDQLVGRTGLTPEVLSSMLLLLELEGEVTPVGGGRYTRTPKVTQ